MKIRILVLIGLIVVSGKSFAQVPVDVYKKPLKEVLNDVEQKYKIKIQYSESLVKGVDVSYSNWRYRSGTEETLTVSMGFKEGRTQEMLLRTSWS